MKSVAALALIAALAAASPAAAQFGWGQEMDMSNFATLDPTAVSSDWRACTNEASRFSTEEIIAGCGHVFANSSRPATRAYALWWRGFAYKRTGQAELAAADYQAALAEFEAWSQADPRSIDAHVNRACLLVSMHEYDQASAELAIADRMRRRQPRVIGAIGHIAFLRGDYATAITLFDRADAIARMDHAGEILTHNRCEARAAAGVEMDETEEICDRAVRASQGHPATFVSRGFYRFRRNDMDGALADFESALSRDPNNASALYGRSVVAARAGRQEAADADLARARELNPETIEYYANAGMRP